MCGIFGIIANEKSRFTPQTFQKTFNRLSILSESRGREASGVALLRGEHIRTYKDSVTSSVLRTHSAYQQLFSQTFSSLGVAGLNDTVVVIGHSRLITNTLETPDNRDNQPVVTHGVAGVHNGIIVNDEELWKVFPDMRREFSVDSEVIFCLIRRYLDQGQSLVEAVRGTFRNIEGTASIAVLFEDYDEIVLATNNGSLYLWQDHTQGQLIFGSEQYILKTLLNSHNVLHLRAGTGLVVHTKDLTSESFLLGEGEGEYRSAPRPAPRAIQSLSSHSAQREESAAKEDLRDHQPLLSQYEQTKTLISQLRRCRRCVLPQTMPYMTFDAQGVCNYCRSYHPLDLPGDAALKQRIDPFRSAHGEPDCLVALSGGRDSSYGLHYIKRVLKMNPIAYTYDWGMITDLARRNISRICAKLGVEHILVSADIARKRSFIRYNVTAWLRKPDLGMIPLFMAGDKQFFYYAQTLKSQAEVPVVFLCENPFERTDFKTGFSGIAPAAVRDKHIFSLSLAKKFKLAMYYGRQYLLNPGYLNPSVMDTLSAYRWYYLTRHDFINVYEYVPWEEEKIVATLKEEYDWEVAEDTTTTWRIGDGTASFYNYIYYTVAGFTENDTFRSHQVREGMLERNRALQLVDEENQPRYDAMQWYCDMIGLDFQKTMQVIHTIPKRYTVN